ncbi:Acetate permease ActP cation/acetate symporter [Moraxella catarrhalis]|nr:Acetate permease ActP cation/acetate symporter [Moraxella catarrhalis]
MLVCHLLFILACTTYVIGQMTGAGVAFSRFLEVDSNTGLIIAAIVVLFYAVFGGHERHHLYPSCSALWRV